MAYKITIINDKAKKYTSHPILKLYYGSKMFSYVPWVKCKCYIVHEFVPFNSGYTDDKKLTNSVNQDDKSSIFSLI